MNEALKETDSEQMVFYSRYEALGIPLPDPKTVCQGGFDGVGVVPTKGEEEPYRTLWLEAEAKEPTDDGWHFVTCPACNGTGKRNMDDPTCHLNGDLIVPDTIE